MENLDKFKLIFVSSKGDEVELYSAPYRLQRVTGIADVDADTQTQRIPFLDGVDYIDSLLQPRYFDILLQIRANDHGDLEERRRYLSRVFNPKNGMGKLRYISNTSEREIPCVSLTVPKMPDSQEDRSRWYQRATIQLMAPDSYWRSLEINEDEITSFVPLFEFEFEGEFEFGIEGFETIIQNDGDSEVPILIRVNGPTINPRLENSTTGEFIEVSGELFLGDVMEINTDTRQVTVNGVDAFQFINISSSFFSLALGENVLKYESDAGDENATLEIIYQKRYNSV